MKNIIIYLVVLVSISWSFTIVTKIDFRPPGTVEIVDNFFFDETELTNINWKEYVSYQKIKFGEYSPEHLFSIPDTTVWRTEKSDNEPWVKTYYQHAAYNRYPVVGVSHEQATAYCQWRTERVREMLIANGHDTPKKFAYRLPTKTEWELIANADFSEKIKKQIASKKNQGRSLYNMKYKSRKDKMMFSNPRDSTFFSATPLPSSSYFPNKYGVYHTFGNVAEMVAEKGIAKGGSWVHEYEEIVPTNKDVSYENPTMWLGFRCVCEVYEY